MWRSNRNECCTLKTRVQVEQLLSFCRTPTVVNSRFKISWMMFRNRKATVVIFLKRNHNLCNFPARITWIFSAVYLQKKFIEKNQWPTSPSFAPFLWCVLSVSEVSFEAPLLEEKISTYFQFDNINSILFILKYAWFFPSRKLTKNVYHLLVNIDFPKKAEVFQNTEDSL